MDNSTIGVCFERKIRLWSNKLTVVYSCIDFLLWVHGRHISCQCNAPKSSCRKGSGCCHNRLGDHRHVNGGDYKFRRTLGTSPNHGVFRSTDISMHNNSGWYVVHKSRAANSYSHLFCCILDGTCYMFTIITIQVHLLIYCS